MYGYADDDVKTTGSDAIQSSPVVQRRRPGRIQNVSAALIPLLRGHPGAAGAAKAIEGDDLTSARGILIGAGISSLLWVGAWFAVRAMLGH